MPTRLDQTYQSPGAAGFATARVAMKATAGQAEKVTLPPWARVVSVSFRASDDATAEIGKIASSATDGSAIGNDFYPVGLGGLSWRVAEGEPSSGREIYLAGSTNSGFAHLLLEQLG